MGFEHRRDIRREEGDAISLLQSRRAESRRETIHAFIKVATRILYGSCSPRVARVGSIGQRWTVLISVTAHHSIRRDYCWAVAGVVAPTRITPTFPSMAMLVPSGFDNVCSFVRIRFAASGG